LAGSGRNGVSVASVTFRANTLPYWLCQASAFLASGSGPVSSAIAVGWSGVAMGVILSFWANAGAMPVQNRASARAMGAVPRPNARMKRVFRVIRVSPFGEAQGMGIAAATFGIPLRQ